MTTDTTRAQNGFLLRGENLSRALVFSSFWGSIFFVLAFLSQLITFRRSPATVRSDTVLAGGGIFVGGFVGSGTLLIAIASSLSGKTPAEQAREQLGTAGEDRGPLRTALSAGLGSLLPFLFTAGSLRLAGRLTGAPALSPQEAISLPRAAATNALLTALIAAAVTQITGWVARDARAAVREQA